MLVVQNDRTVSIDVDDTLLMYDDNFMQPHEGAIRIVDPNDNQVVYLTPHQRHVDLIKKWKGRGYFIEVWSANGFAWAERAVRALNLEDYVDIVTTKREKFVDDLPASQVLGTRVYLNPKITNKNIEISEEVE
jgi:predicted phosphatase